MPAEQSTHELNPFVAVMVPGAQVEAALAPVGHAEPAGHVVQELCAVPAVEVRKLPAAHADGALAPSGQKLPAGHGVHDVWPLAV